VPMGGEGEDLVVEGVPAQTSARGPCSGERAG
jgi:hypothetical protein